MKGNRKTCTWLFVLCTLVGYAQKTPLEKYNLVPPEHMEIYLDYVSQFKGKTTSTILGDYIGQVDKKGMYQGFGMFLQTNGSKITGTFRDGKLLFGIHQTSNNTLVGSAEKSVVYDNCTGNILYVLHGKDAYALEGPEQYDYCFSTIRYANGDVYIGELYKGKRHGFGLYYYADGTIWYGSYENDLQRGCGAFFTETGNLLIGNWQGEQVNNMKTIKIK